MPKKTTKKPVAKNTLKKSKKRPAREDVNQAAFRVLKEATRDKS